MNEIFDFEFSFFFDSIYEAEIIFHSLSPEIEDHRFDRSMVAIKLNNRTLFIQASAQDFNAAKATITSIFRWISTILKAINTLPKLTR